MQDEDRKRVLAARRVLDALDELEELDKDRQGILPSVWNKDNAYVRETKRRLESYIEFHNTSAVMEEAASTPLTTKDISPDECDGLSERAKSWLRERLERKPNRGRRLRNLTLGDIWIGKTADEILKFFGHNVTSKELWTPSEWKKNHATTRNRSLP